LFFDNASHFSSHGLETYVVGKGIKVKYSTNYYVQGNGLDESSNKNQLKILKITIYENHKKWHTTLFNALWDDRITLKDVIGNSPFFLVYGREDILLPLIFLPSLQLS